ncbi:MAG: ABC transporter permease subunit [Candidatus Sericytochromatia bacterium]|nr:ABC transporter permease subunit [Candidatus Tanganyikabacteria bacterium]
MSTFAIARIFFREAIRDRILNLIWLFAIAMLGLSLFMGDLSAGSELKVVKDLGLGIINLLLVLVAIMIGASSIHKEIDKRTVYVVLSKPIARWQFLVGKFLGLFGVLLLLAVAMGVAYYLLLFLMVREFQLIYATAVGLMLLEASVIAALAILFSAITSPTLSAIYVLGVYLVGHNTETILKFGDRGEAPEYIRAIGRVLYHVLPNLETLNIKNQVVYGAGIGGVEAAWAIAYAAALIAVFMTLATLAFVTREI